MFPFSFARPSSSSRRSSSAVSSGRREVISSYNESIAPREEEKGANVARQHFPKFVGEFSSATIWAKGREQSRGGGTRIATFSLRKFAQHDEDTTRAQLTLLSAPRHSSRIKDDQDNMQISREREREIPRRGSRLALLVGVFRKVRQRVGTLFRSYQPGCFPDWSFPGGFLARRICMRRAPARGFSWRNIISVGEKESGGGREERGAKRLHRARRDITLAVYLTLPLFTSSYPALSFPSQRAFSEGDGES